MVAITYSSDIDGGDETAKGSNNRLNVSSRSDGRSYYASRDGSQTFSVSWNDSDSAAGDDIVYWKNTDTNGKELVISFIEVYSANNALFKVKQVTGTATGTTVTPSCSNRNTVRSASSTAIEAAGTAITGLTDGATLGYFGAGSSGKTFRIDDVVRLGQDGAIAIEYVAGTTGQTAGTIEGFFE
jgi:hypothetical protein